MAIIVNIEDLADWLGQQEQNTIDTPYAIDVQGLTSSNIGTLKTALDKTNNNIYVDLSSTTLPSIQNFSNGLKNTRIVYAPVIPSSITNLANAFQGTFLKEINIESETINDLTGTFKQCVNLVDCKIKTTANNVALYETLYGCTILKNVDLEIPYCTTIGDVCRYCDCIENLVWNIPDGSLYYSFLDGASYQTIKKAKFNCNRIGAWSNEYTFGNALTSIEELEIVTNPQLLAQASYSISSVFGTLTTLKSVKVEITFGHTEGEQNPRSIASFYNFTALENAVLKFHNISNCRLDSGVFYFYGCSSLEKIEIYGVPKDYVFASTSRNAFANCSSLTEVVISELVLRPSEQWHGFRLKLYEDNGSDYVEGKVFDKEGNTTSIQSTELNKTSIILPIKTDELWFPDSEIGDAGVEDIIQDVIESRYTYYNKTVINPDGGSLVFWANNKNKFLTNLDIGGGGGGSGITVYETEEELEEDLPNLSDGDIVGTYGDGEPTFNDAPLGSTMSYLGNTDPSDGKWLICDGRDTTGTAIELETHYPNLYMFLGGTNVLPEIFDHSRPSAWETITISTNSASPTTMQYDGVIYVQASRSGSQIGLAVKVFINGTEYKSSLDSTATNYWTTFMELPVKKGDNVYTTINAGTFDKMLGCFYKHHKIIKATSYVDYYHAPASEIVQIEQYFDNGLQRAESYSTTETLTGGKWIDEKKIYRKTITGLSYQSYWVDSWKSVYFDISSSLFTEMDKILEFKCIANNGNVTYGMLNDNRTSVNILNTRNSSPYPIINTIIVEYTKTTD